jgi:hypothetical protein
MMTAIANGESLPPHRLRSWISFQFHPNHDFFNRNGTLTVVFIELSGNPEIEIFSHTNGQRWAANHDAHHSSSSNIPLARVTVRSHGPNAWNEDLH